MPGRHEELYSKVVRKLHPDRSLSPPQKKVEFNDNKLGKFFSIKSLFFSIKSLNYSGKCLKSSKNVVLKKKKLSWKRNSIKCYLIHWNYCAIEFKTKEKPSNQETCTVSFDRWCDFNHQARLFILDTLLYTHFPKGYNTRSFFPHTHSTEQVKVYTWN